MECFMNILQWYMNMYRCFLFTYT